MSQRFVGLDIEVPPTQELKDREGEGWLRRGEIQPQDDEYSRFLYVADATLFYVII